MNRLRIESLRAATDQAIDELSDVLLDAVDSNAGISFMAGLTKTEARTWWRTVIDGLSPRAALLVARDDTGIVGTVQLQPAWPPNQPHRADVAKLLVRRRARGAGIGRRLMEAVEEAARGQGRRVLVLDTASDTAERLYERLGWQRAGVVPDYALMPDGALCATTFFYKQV
jgi:GNAT superfamily N-acetyltransferase